jgi:predicted nucleic acid-binding Zn ribbon protein
MQAGHASIQTLLGGLMKNRNLVGSLRRAMVLTLWDQVVGEVVARKSWAETMADGVLTVGVVNHTWAAELELLKPKILANYRQLLGRSSVKDVIFRVGARRNRRRDATPHPPVRLRPDSREELTMQPLPGELLSGVQNPDVRNLLGPVFARLRAERTWKEEHGWRHCDACDRVYHGAQCPTCQPKE